MEKALIVATGLEAIHKFESGESVVLCKYADPVSAASCGLPAGDAYCVAKQDPQLIYAIRSKDA